MTPLNTTLVYGSHRKARTGLRVAKYIEATLEARGHKITLIDTMEENLHMLDKTYSEYERGKAPENLQKLADIFTNSDAIIVISAEYNHSIPPDLSNLLDYFMKEYFWKPSGIVTYSVGDFGGARVAIQLRAILGELGMPSIPSILSIPRHEEVFGDAGDSKNDKTDRLASRFIDELEWYAQAMRDKRKEGTPY